MQGLYIHVPFCVSKCPYCDFYSVPLPNDDILDTYTAEVCRRLETVDTPCDTLYFGGGTPSLLGGRRLASIIQAAHHHGLLDCAEITLEANPAERLYDTFAAFAQAGGNRLSMGMQAATTDGLHALGRRHTTEQLALAIEDAHKAGLNNLSLDIMLATPSQTTADIDAAVSICRDAHATHVSSYLLKIEEGTPFYDRHSSLELPNEDDTVALYKYTVQALSDAGYAQYEISNFAKPGYESRHNIKYWNGDRYLGIGPAAHSFVNGKRWYMPRSISYFLEGGLPVEDTEDEGGIAVGSPDEYAMLRLRLTDGLRMSDFEARFHTPFPSSWIQRAKALPDTLVLVDGTHIAFTTDGFLLSNALISRILWNE